MREEERKKYLKPSNLTDTSIANQTQAEVSVLEMRAK